MTPLLQSISVDLTGLLHKLGRTHSFAGNEEVFGGGDVAAYLPVVLSGSVKMIHFLEPGKEVIIDIFYKGEMFAVPPVFDGGRYPATAIAMEDTRLLLIDRRDFLSLLRESSEFSFAVIEWMCGMLREKTATIQNLATASPEHRVGNILLRLANKELGQGPGQDPAETPGHCADGRPYHRNHHPGRSQTCRKTLDHHYARQDHCRCSGKVAAPP